MLNSLKSRAFHLAKSCFGSYRHEDVWGIPVKRYWNVNDIYERCPQEGTQSVLWALRGRWGDLWKLEKAANAAVDIWRFISEISEHKESGAGRETERKRRRRRLGKAANPASLSKGRGSKRIQV